MIKVSSDADKVLIAKIHEAAQDHVFAFWDQLTPDKQDFLLDQLRSLDLGLIRKLIAQYLQGTQEVLEARVLTPAPIIKLYQLEGPEGSVAEARAAGEEALRKGSVGIITAAGETENGSGFEKPKGLCPIGPVSGKSIFRHHAEKILAIARKYRAAPLWIIATSPSNHDATTAHFKAEEYFGLNRTDVLILIQEDLPAVNFRGKILLSEPGKVAMVPDGHGGVLLSLLSEDPFRALELRGIEHLFYFQVDNPLVQIADPISIGIHILKGSEVSSKAVSKVDPEEKVGIFCRCNGLLGVVEHGELSEADKVRRGPDGLLEFSAANIAIHLFSMAFLRRLRAEGVELAYHSTKMVTHSIDRKGKPVIPRQPNSIHFKRFVFDLLAFARSALVMEAERANEFSPVKSPHGRDSLDSARRDLSRMYARWLRAAGAQVIERGGEDPEPIEISPLYALDGDELKSKIRLPLIVESGFYLE